MSNLTFTVGGIDVEKAIQEIEPSMSIERYVMDSKKTTLFIRMKQPPTPEQRNEMQKLLAEWPFFIFDITWPMPSMYGDTPLSE